MITKLKYILIFLFCFSIYIVSGQNRKNEIIYDVYGNPLCRYFQEIGGKDSTTYIKLDGKEISTSNQIGYEGGNNSLLKLMDSIYFSTYFDGDEINSFIMYYVLFDTDLNIDEIRIYKRLGVDDQYDDFIINSLKSTQGKWQKKHESSEKWYLFFGRYKLR
ncbi:hypothetical protein LJB94_00625 [Odoribacter sp. OttesenSCG-928-G04]|nr:hypothetical protein [Odoribacter sp. OttesenSCG-928-G04]